MLIPNSSHQVLLEVDESYLPEVRAWFAVGALVILLRHAARIRTVGLRGLDGDDFLMILALVLWTIDATIVEITYHTGGSINAILADVTVFSDSDIDLLTYGTKWHYASFYSYSGLIWTQKFSVLFFYRRLKADEWRRTSLTINCLFWINGLAYLAVCLTAAFSCWPLERNWAVRPLPPLNCTFRPQNFLVLVVFSVLTDALMVSVPLPILWRLRVSPLRKVGVALLLCSGVVLIATAVVRAAVTISGPPSMLTINRWGSRETGVDVVAVNAPLLAPLFGRAFWRWGPYRPGNNGPVSGQDGAADMTRGRKARRITVFEIPSALESSQSGTDAMADPSGAAPAQVDIVKAREEVDVEKADAISSVDIGGEAETGRPSKLVTYNS